MNETHGAAHGGGCCGGAKSLAWDWQVRAGSFVPQPAGVVAMPGGELVTLNPTDFEKLVS